MATFRGLVLVSSILAVAGGGLSPVRADVDLNGSWVATTPLFSPAECLNVVQSGTTLTATPCNGAGPAYTGTIDPVTGVFDISQPAVCAGEGDRYARIQGTAALDSQTFSGAYTVHLWYCKWFWCGCLVFDDVISGVRERCGDGILNLDTEQCDDGNTQDGDCCSSTCQKDPDGSACSDGDPLTCEACVSGSCDDRPCLPLDHYKCYKGTDLENPPFAQVTVGASDQFTSDQVVAKKLGSFCVPVDKNGEGINNSDAYLTCYWSKGDRLNPRVRVEVNNQFGLSQLELSTPKLLCVPSTQARLP